MSLINAPCTIESVLLLIIVQSAFKLSIRLAFKSESAFIISLASLYASDSNCR
jgi:hypothetical protein